MAGENRKPAGGIVAAEIVPLGGVSRPVPLADDRSSYAEQIVSDGGILRVHHTLTLVVPRNQAQPFIDLAPLLIRDGMVAWVTTTAGEELTIGWSERFKNEQPLRLTSLILDTGTRPVDENNIILKLESDDTTALQELQDI